MRKRTAACALACVGVLAATMIFAATRVVFAAECHDGPAGSTPAGYHWNYRLDRANERKCWYLKRISARTEKDASPRAPRSARPPDDDLPPHSATQPTKEKETLFKEFLLWQRHQESRR